jgi:hypothetical protein
MLTRDEQRIYSLIIKFEWAYQNHPRHPQPHFRKSGYLGNHQGLACNLQPEEWTSERINKAVEGLIEKGKLQVTYEPEHNQPLIYTLLDTEEKERLITIWRNPEAIAQC